MRIELRTWDMQERSASGRVVVVALGLIALLCQTAVAADAKSPSASGNTPDKQAAKTPTNKTPSAKTSEKTSDTKKSETKPAKRRLVTVAGGEITLDIQHWPLLGKPGAKYVFVEMFDYTCPYCRATHQSVRGAMERFGDDLAIIALPVPLDAACNRTVQFTAGEHAEACELAKLAVAVWRVDRKKFAVFHSWLFEPAYRRTAAEARQHAAVLVGEHAIREELNLPHAGNYIARHVELYERIGSGSLPKILFPRSTISGSVDSASTLIDMIPREGTQSP